jgi:hypothetical protein
LLKGDLCADCIQWSNTRIVWTRRLTAWFCCIIDSLLEQLVPFSHDMCSTTILLPSLFAQLSFALLPAAKPTHMCFLPFPFQLRTSDLASTPFHHSPASQSRNPNSLFTQLPVLCKYTLNLSYFFREMLFLIRPIFPLASFHHLILGSPSHFHLSSKSGSGTGKNERGKEGRK